MSRKSLVTGILFSFGIVVIFVGFFIYFYTYQRITYVNILSELGIIQCVDSDFVQVRKEDILNDNQAITPMVVIDEIDGSVSAFLYAKVKDVNGFPGVDNFESKERTIKMENLSGKNIDIIYSDHVSYVDFSKKTYERYSNQFGNQNLLADTFLPLVYKTFDGHRYINNEDRVLLYWKVDNTNSKNICKNTKSIIKTPVTRIVY